MIGCGDLDRGFVRLECRSCRAPRVVPLSCKTRLCPSCAGRRMNEQSAHLVDRVLPHAPYRQWVLTLPWELARAAAFDARLSSRVFGLLAEEIARWQCGRARAAGVEQPHAGAILEIQWFADGARTWPHAHLLAPDGVFHETADGLVQFHGIGPPRDRDVGAIVRRLSARVARVLKHRANAATDDEAPPASSQLLLQCASTAPTDRVVVEGSATPGKRAANRPGPRRRKPLCVRSPEGLELHADVHVRAADRAGLERLCRYITRPPICAERLSWLPDGRIEFRLKRTWKGGVRSLIFEPLDLIARFTALIPLPRAHMRRFYGVFAPAHSLRSRVVPQPPSTKRTDRPVAPKRPARMTWADLLKRTLELTFECTRYLICVVSRAHHPPVSSTLGAGVHPGRRAVQPARRSDLVRAA